MTSKQFGLPKIDSKMHCFFDRFFHPFFFDFRSFFLQKSNKILPKINSKTHHIFDRFFHRFFFDFGSIFEANLGRLGGVLGHLGPSWRPLGGLLGRLGGLLGPLGGQDPPGTRGSCFWRPLGTVLASFLGGFCIIVLMNFLYFSYLILQDVNMS